MVPAVGRHPAADGEGHEFTSPKCSGWCHGAERGDKGCWHHSVGLETKPEEESVHSALKMRLPSHWLAPHSLRSCSEEAPRAAESASHLLLTGHSGFPTQMDHMLGARTG